LFNKLCNNGGTPLLNNLLNNLVKRVLNNLFNNLINRLCSPFSLGLPVRIHQPKRACFEKACFDRTCSGPLLQPLGGLSPLAGQQRPRHQGLQGREAAAVHPLLHQSLGHGLVPFGHRRQQTIRQVGAGWRGKAGGQGHGRGG